MSAITNSPSRLSTYALLGLEWMHATISRRRALDDLRRLSERDLCDVGLSPHDIEAAIEHAMTGPSLRHRREF